MPEGDTIFRAARTLKKALAGQVITRFETQFPQLQRVHDDTPITGRTVADVTAHGKWLRMDLSGGLILLTHMLMSGSWHIYRPGERWRRSRYDMRILLVTEKFEAVAFKVPVAEFHTAASLAERPGFSQLGPDVLATDFDERQATANLRANPEMEIAEALLRQSVLAGLGNVFKSEVCFASGVNPFRNVARLSNEEIERLVATARKFLQANVMNGTGDRIMTYGGTRRTTGRANPEESLWVYGRGGQPCRHCGTPIQMRKQGPGARVTFWCPQCQPD